MKKKEIKFFTQEDNFVEKTRVVKEEVFIPEAHITSNGKLSLPLPTLEFLGVESTLTARFKVGVDQNKKGFVGLYLIPSDESDPTAFELVKIGRGFSLLLKGIFIKLGLAYRTTEFHFTLKKIDLDGIGTGFFAKLVDEKPRTKKGDDGDED